MDLLTLNRLPEELRNAVTHCDLAPGESLFRQGDSADALFVVETGRVKLARYSIGDKMVIFQVATVGETLAEIALFADTYPCAAVAEVASRVMVFPKHLLLPVLCENAELAADFMAMLVRRIQALKIRLELRDIRAAHERLLRYLRYSIQPGEQNIVNFDRPLKDIAADLGLTPETLSRALARLEEEGLIMRSRLQITLPSSPAA